MLKKDIKKQKPKLSLNRIKAGDLVELYSISYLLWKGILKRISGGRLKFHAVREDPKFFPRMECLFGRTLTVTLFKADNSTIEVKEPESDKEWFVPIECVKSHYKKIL